jgi:sugar phosphate isomerase/epimerase
MHAQHKPELTVAYWTIAGLFPGVPPEYSSFDFKQRVEAAARAGFCGMGIWHTDLDHILEKRTPREMKQILDDNGMRFVEVEFLTDWFMDGELRKQSDVRRKKLLTAAEGLGATQIKVGDFYQRKCPMPQLIDAFAVLCSDAADHGTRIVFEPMAVSMINTLEDCLTMLDGAGVSNGGIMFDLWHVVNLGISYEDLARWPAKYLFGAEVDDGTFKASGGGRREPIVNRRFCGEGEFDIKGFIQAIKQTGFSGPWGVEIFSEELVDKPLEELSGRAFTTAMHQF